MMEKNPNTPLNPLNLPTMSLAEKFILFFATVFGLFGLFSGFVREIFSLAGLGLAFFGAPPAARIFFHFAPFAPTTQSKAFITAMLGTIIYFVIAHFGRRLYAAHVRQHFVRKTIDRFLGTVLGCVKGAFLAFIVTKFLS